MELYGDAVPETADANVVISRPADGTGSVMTQLTANLTTTDGRHVTRKVVMLSDGQGKIINLYVLFETFRQPDAAVLAVD